MFGQGLFKNKERYLVSALTDILQFISDTNQWKLAQTPQLKVWVLHTNHNFKGFPSYHTSSQLATNLEVPHKLSVSQNSRKCYDYSLTIKDNSETDK